MSDPDPRASARISPTAHYTGYVWQRHGLAHPALRTVWGSLMFHGLQPLMLASHVVNDGLTLEAYLIQRHRVIDHLLEDGLARGVGQVLEIAAGLSGRGLRFATRYRERGLTYVEADLPGMAARKRALLDGAGLRGARHHVVDVDALADAGALSIFGVAERYLDPSRGAAIITEGLLNYFSHADVVGMWGRFARLLGRFPEGLYLADLHMAPSAAFIGAGLFQRGLELFARGMVHFPFPDDAEALAALAAVGFGPPSGVHPTSGFCERLGLDPIGGPPLVWIVEGRRRAS